MKCALPIYLIFILVDVLKRSIEARISKSYVRLKKYHGNIVDFEQHDLDRLSKLECCKALMYSDMDISAVRERVEEQTQTGNNTRVPADL